MRLESLRRLFPIAAILLGSQLLAAPPIDPLQEAPPAPLLTDVTHLDDLGEEQPHWLVDNLRATLDISSRYTTRRFSGQPSLNQFIGLDLHKVFSNKWGDWGTLMVQSYLTRIDNVSPPPRIFDDDHDWELVYRILNFNFTGLTRNRLNLRVGHFEIPFGLEQIINTNGTLRDYTHGRNFSLKADWGVTVNGVLSGAEYEIGLSRGSGNEYSDRGGPVIVAGRVGTPQDENLVLGASGFYGEVASGSGRNTTRRRVGLDVQWYRGCLGLFGEVAVGRDENVEVANGLWELNWRDSAEAVIVYVQNRCFFQEVQGHWDDSLSSQFGVRYEPDTHWALSAQLSQPWAEFGNSSRAAVVSLQVRYRF